MKKPILFAVILFTAQFSQAQWESDVRLTNDPSASNTAYTSGQHAIASSGDTIHVVWSDARDGNGEIYYKRSTDGGMTWGSDTRLTYEPAISYGPSIAVSGSVVHISWVDMRNYWLEDWGEIYYKRSPDGGNNWGPDKRLSYYEGYSYHPSLVASGELIHVVWYEQYEDMWEILYKHSLNGGVTWEDDVRLTNDSSISAGPSICTSGTVLHVTWHDFRDGNYEIYYKRSTNNGTSWGADTQLTYNDSISSRSCVCVSASNVHVVWSDNRDGNKEIYYKRSSDGGLTWGADTRLTYDQDMSDYPNIAISGSGLFIVWPDDRDGNKEIYYKLSSDGGMSWNSDFRLTNNPSNSDKAFISQSGCQLNVVWTDERDDNYEIYYKRDPTGWDILTADFTASHNVICPEDVVQFTDFTSCHPTQWQWTFPGGTPGTSNQQNPQVVYNTPGIYDVTLYVSHGDLNDEITKTDYITVLSQTLSIPGTPTGPDDLCQNPPNSHYNTSGSPGATDYLWQLSPADAGVANGLGTMVMINWTDDFIGDALLMVKALNICTESAYSSPLPISVTPSPTAYVVKGGPYCIGSSGSTIELSGSQSNHTYELFLDDQPTGNTMQGNGSMINFPNIRTPGTYTMMATENSTLCSNMMEGAVEVYVIYVPENPPKPQGPDYVDLFFNTETEYTTEGSSGSASYEWSLDPSDAGTIDILNVTTALVTWNPYFLGIANLSVRGVNECGTSGWSESLPITVSNTVGWKDTENKIMITIYPNPGNGIFKVSLQSEKEKVVTLRLINTLGEAIFEKRNMTISRINTEFIIMTGVHSGVYYLLVVGETAMSIHKVIIQKN